jgi:hypothetical protein
MDSIGLIIVLTYDLPSIVQRRNSFGWVYQRKEYNYGIRRVFNQPGG